MELFLIQLDIGKINLNIDDVGVNPIHCSTASRKKHSGPDESLRQKILPSIALATASPVKKRIALRPNTCHALRGKTAGTDLGNQSTIKRAIEECAVSKASCRV
jgi:hypothetical protein